VLFSKKSAPVTEPEPEVDDRPVGAPAPKGRPTPKRREQEARRKRPLVDNGRGATAEQKARTRAARSKAREGMLRGDDRYLGARDRGPLKRFLRDSVDSRWNIGEFLLPLMLLILALSLLQTTWAQMGVFVLAYGLILAGVLDGVLLWRRTKRRVVEAFGEEPPKGSAMYLVIRAFQMRMSRVPRPQVKRGDPVVPRR
jgi:Flp pilus assembly protein TadB